MPNQYKNKVIYGDSVLMDITDTTAEAGDVASGAVFYAKNGARTVGTFTQAQSDWIEDDTTDSAYILNKPPIIAGDGEGSAVENQIEPEEDAAIYTLTITGEANATVFSYTTEDTLPTNISRIYTRSIVDYTKSNGTHVYAAITAFSSSNRTITLSNSLNTSAISAEELKIYYGYHKAIGKYSHAEGSHADAIGNYSHAEGSTTKAIASYSHAEGAGTRASGSASHSEGYQTQAIGSSAHAEGWITKALTSYSHAEGHSSTAENTAAHAEGYSTYSYGYGSHSEGFDTTARGNGAHAEGYGGWAYANMSHTEGGYVYFVITLIGDANALTYSVSDQQTMRSEDVDSITGGIINTTSNWQLNKPTVQSAVLNNKVLTSITLDKTLDANNAVSGPYYLLVPNQAIGISSHTEGSGNLAKGAGAHVEGASSIAAGADSHSEGVGNYSAGAISHTEGWGVIAGSSYQHVQGKWNIRDDNNTYADIVGNGTADEARSNAYTLDWSGNGWFAGKVSAGTVDTPASVTDTNDLTTKQYVDNAIFEKQGKAVYGSTKSNDKNYISPYMASLYILDDPFYRNLIMSHSAPIYGQLFFNSWNVAASANLIVSNTILYNNGLLCATLVGDIASNTWTFTVYPIQDALTFDSIPTNDSTNPVTSGGVYTALSSKANRADIPSASSTAPVSDGTAAVGVSTAYARADHVHPKITQIISISNNVITLTGSDGSTSSVTLPVYDGTVSSGGGS